MAGRLPQLSRGSLALVLNALLGLLALGLAFAPAGEAEPQLRLAAANGSLTLVNSKEGSAIFRAVAMRPGEPASGSVTITNTGTVNAALTLQPEDASDLPGAGGGRLSGRLDLEIVDVTLPAAPVTVYEGTVKQMGPTDVGSLAPGASRTYRFAATLKPTGGADNAFQGAAITTGFRWNATSIDAATPVPTATPSPTAAPSPTATVAPTGGGAAPAPGPAAPPAAPPPGDAAGADPTGEALGAQLFALPAATAKCVSRRRFAIHVRRPSGMTFSSIAVTVNGRTRLRLKGLEAARVKATVNLKGLPAGKVTVRITAVTSTGRKAVSERTYRTCARKRKR